MPEDAAQKLREELAEMITAKNGVIVDLSKAYKKRLAYQIKKQDVAYVNTILFQSDAVNVVAFKKETDTIESILRGLIIAYDPEKLKKATRRERPAAVAMKSEKTEIADDQEKPAKPADEASGKTEEKPAKPKRKTKLKAELRDIEEKLDEILK